MKILIIVFLYRRQTQVLRAKVFDLEVADTVTKYMESHTGIKCHLGKTQCWAKGGGNAPRGIPDLDVEGEEQVWKGNLEPARNGIRVLGTPQRHRLRTAVLVVLYHAHVQRVQRTLCLAIRTAYVHRGSIYIGY